MKTEAVVIIKDGEKLTIQRAYYIEDGWFIEIIGKHIALYEIPLGGGEAQLIMEFETLKEALDYRSNLT